MDYFLNLTLLSAMLGWLETVLCRVRSSVQLPLMAVNIAETSVDPSHHSLCSSLARAHLDAHQRVFCNARPEHLILHAIQTGLRLPTPKGLAQQYVNRSSNPGYVSLC